MYFPFVRSITARNLGLAVTVLLSLGLGAPARAEFSAFTQALAAAVSADLDIAAYYRDRDYRPLFTAAEDATRRNALLDALARAGDHALPVPRYDAAALAQAFHAVRTEGDRGRLEARMALAFADYARDIQTGVLVPVSVDPGIVREVAVRNRGVNLAAFAVAEPAAFLRALPPKAPAYAQLMKARLQLEAQIAAGGWGEQVYADSLKPGQSGAAVVALRDRLIAMGFMARSATRDYDATIQQAVQSFQLSLGLTADGVAGEGTMVEINRAPEARLKSVIVALERERWLNFDRGSRHIWVNLTDFTARIIDDGKVTFETRSVVGKNAADRRSPEFSDLMEFMMINPSWNVPRSIAVKEYLPQLQANPNAAGHLRITDRSGRVVNRAAVDFTQYTTRNFPFDLRQPPSERNALGLVKFMFPNPYNIYLHDTPSKSLFAREVRDFSHGCVRLSDPFDFAYALLARQTDDPVGEFKRHLETRSENRLDLAQPVPVHLVYFTAFPSAKGKMNYRRDIYGRDARIFDALTEAGVVLAGVQG
ncbi:MAG: L,D-transpeptidase family protein [Pseudorhodobacter sp.]|nr:L,D-transpeptidase family protein [Pseudorhodobacter sp.]